TRSAAAHRKICLPFGIVGARLIWTTVVASLLALASAGSPRRSPFSYPSAGFDARDARSVPSAPNMDLQVAAQQQPAQPPAQPPAVIDRIIFLGNRRVRSDTLKARIFSREGDPYNEETLRRDFQALWNTQFFEDVKLRVEDSPSKPNGKVIVFEVRERPVIRRIRYDGIHSISESD